jgi:hypothetical protein
MNYSEEDILDLAIRVNHLYFNKKDELELKKGILPENVYQAQKKHLFSNCFKEVSGNHSENGLYGLVGAKCRELNKVKKQEVPTEKEKPLVVDLFNSAGVDCIV